MGTNFERPPAAAGHAIEKGIVVVAAVHPVERAVVDGLQAIFDGKIGATADFAQQIQNVVADAVGPGADSQADDGGMCQRFFIDFAQPGQGGIGVRGGLKIGQEARRVAVAAAQPADALVDLLADRLARQSAAGAEAAVVAESAAAGGDGAVDVGAGEMRVDAHFLDPAAKRAAQKAVVAGVAQAGGQPVVARRQRGKRAHGGWDFCGARGAIRTANPYVVKIYPKN